MFCLLGISIRQRLHIEAHKVSWKHGRLTGVKLFIPSSLLSPYARH